MNKKYIKGLVLLGVTLSIGFSSCRVATVKYKAPDVADKDELYRADKSTDTLTIANLPWREYFKDPFLRNLIEEGVANNFDLRIATTRIQQAEAGLSIARGAFFPNVALAGLTNIDVRSTTNALDKSITTFGLGITATWEADIWGKLSSKSKAQRAQLMASHSYRDLIQTSLIANIANSYYSLLALDQQLAVTKETVKLITESTQSMEDMMQAGLLNGAAVEQNKGLLYATTVSIPDLQIKINTLENSLSLLLGRKPGSINRSSLNDQTVPLELEYGVPAQMLAKRPDVLQAEQSFISAFELTNVARTYFYPSLTLQSGSRIGYGAPDLTDFFKPQNLLANLAVGLTQPLFAQNQIKGQLKIANAQQQEALINFEKAVTTASQDVSNVLYTYHTLLTKNDIRKKQVEALTNSVSFTKDLLQAGESNYLEVLTAEQNLLQARLGQVSDKLEQLQASVNLYRALGGGVN